MSHKNMLQPFENERFLFEQITHPRGSAAAGFQEMAAKCVHPGKIAFASRSDLVAGMQPLYFVDERFEIEFRPPPEACPVLRAIDANADHPLARPRVWKVDHG
jgi:hypothetical protein